MSDFTQESWARDLLTRMGYPVTENNMTSVLAWQYQEGGHFHNDATFNPLNSTLGHATYGSMNSVGVSTYPDYETGMAQTIKTIKLGYYDKIRADLQADADPTTTTADIKASPWGTWHGGASTNGALGQAHKYLAAHPVGAVSTVPTAPAAPAHPAPAPAHPAPATPAPVTHTAPATPAPVTHPAAPTTPAPVTHAPTSATPTTTAPVTHAPTSATPTTTAPVTTSAPVVVPSGGASGSFTGADVDGLDRLAHDFTAAAQVVDMVKQACEVIVAAASMFGPFAAAFIAYLKGTVIPWLTKISEALKAMSKVLSVHSTAQKDASSAATSLPSYTSTGTMPTTSTTDAPALPSVVGTAPTTAAPAAAVPAATAHPVELGPGLGLGGLPATPQAPPPAATPAVPAIAATPALLGAAR